MFDKTLANKAYLDAVFRQASKKKFLPKATVRCPADPVFRTQLARDLACLLDVDDNVAALLRRRCQPLRQTQGLAVPQTV